MIFRGSGVALSTPFTQDGINFSTAEKLIEFHIANDTDAIIACGTTGEPSTMTGDEKKTMIEFTINKVNGRIPVIAGIGGNNTADVVACAKHAQDSGADGLLAVTPYYNKSTRRGTLAHFHAIADAVDLPIIIYNVPARTNVNLSPELFVELAQHPNIVAVKEACADICQIAETARLCQGKADIYSGSDEIVVPIMSLGGIGVISVIANILPKFTHDMVMTYLDGDIKKACEMQLRMNPLVTALFCEVSPIPVKTALRQMGYDMGPLRLPLTDMEQNHLDFLISEMKKFDLI